MALRYDSDEYRQWAARVLTIYKLVNEDKYKTSDWVLKHEMHPDVENLGEVYRIIDYYRDGYRIDR